MVICFKRFLSTFKPCIVKLKVFGTKRNFFQTLPLHASQQEIDASYYYSVFSYYISPTYDFKHEILSHGVEVEVLSPDWLQVKSNSFGDATPTPVALNISQIPLIVRIYSKVSKFKSYNYFEAIFMLLNVYIYIFLLIHKLNSLKQKLPLLQ